MKLLVPFIAVLLLVGCATSEPTTWSTAESSPQWHDGSAIEDSSLESIAFVGYKAEIYTRDKPTKIIQMHIIDVKETSITGNNLYITNGPQPEVETMKIDRSNIMKILVYEVKEKSSGAETTAAETSGADSSGAENSVGKTALKAGIIVLCTLEIVAEIIDGSHNPNC